MKQYFSKEQLLVKIWSIFSIKISIYQYKYQHMKTWKCQSRWLLPFTQSLFSCSYGKPFKELEPKKMPVVEEILEKKIQEYVTPKWEKNRIARINLVHLYMSKEQRTLINRNSVFILQCSSGQHFFKVFLLFFIKLMTLGWCDAPKINNLDKYTLKAKN